MPSAMAIGSSGPLTMGRLSRGVSPPRPPKSFGSTPTLSRAHLAERWRRQILARRDPARRCRQPHRLRLRMVRGRWGLLNDTPAAWMISGDYRARLVHFWELGDNCHLACSSDRRLDSTATSWCGLEHLSGGRPGAVEKSRALLKVGALGHFEVAPFRVHPFSTCLKPLFFHAVDRVMPVVINVGLHALVITFFEGENVLKTGCNNETKLGEPERGAMSCDDPAPERGFDLRLFLQRWRGAGKMRKSDRALRLAIRLGSIELRRSSFAATIFRRFNLDGVFPEPPNRWSRAGDF